MATRALLVGVVLAGSLIGVVVGDCDREEYTCPTRTLSAATGEWETTCLTWHQVGESEQLDLPDGQPNPFCDCPACEDETGEGEGEILFCPPTTSQGTVFYVTVSTDPGKNYATVHQQKSISPDNPCVDRFRFDADGDGEEEEYNGCTKVCTTHAETDAIRKLNPTLTLEESNTQGCEELCEPGNLNCQTARLWCATEVDDDLKPTQAAHCSEGCGQSFDPEIGTRLSTLDRFGNPCNPYLAMPFLGSRVLRRATTEGLAQRWRLESPGSLNWTFAENRLCSSPSASACDPQICSRDRCPEYKDPLHEDIKYYLRSTTEEQNSIQLTVYHPSSRKMRYHLPCGPSDSDCCQFSIRLLDGEDPALQYKPFGPEQYLSRCKDVTQCKQCQWEVKMPSASSDRICRDHKTCGDCEYEDQAGTAFTDRVCSPFTIATCNARTHYLVPINNNPNSPEFYQYREEYCEGEPTRVKTSDVTCIMQEICLPSEFDITYEEMQSTNSDAEDSGEWAEITRCTTESLYTRQRECQKIFVCVAPAVAVLGPTLANDGDGGGCLEGEDCWYIGDRACQCPDFVDMHDAQGRNPLLTPTYELLANGISTPQRAAGDTTWDGGVPQNAFLPIKYFGSANMNEHTYSCSPCSACERAVVGTPSAVVGTSSFFVARQCTHGRVNADYCHGTHPRGVDDSTKLRIDRDLIPESLLELIPSDLLEVDVYPVTRLTIIAAYFSNDARRENFNDCVQIDDEQINVVEARQFLKAFDPSAGECSDPAGECSAYHSITPAGVPTYPPHFDCSNAVRMDYNEGLCRRIDASEEECSEMEALACCEECNEKQRSWLPENRAFSWTKWPEYKSGLGLSLYVPAADIYSHHQLDSHFQWNHDVEDHVPNEWLYSDHDTQCIRMDECVEGCQFEHTEPKYATIKLTSGEEQQYYVSNRVCVNYYVPTDDEFIPLGRAENGTADSVEKRRDSNEADADYPGWICTTLKNGTSEGRRSIVEQDLPADASWAERCVEEGHTWQKVLGSETLDRVAKMRKTCKPCEHETSPEREEERRWWQLAGTSCPWTSWTSDRTCAPTTVCGAENGQNRYKTDDPTETDDRQCADLPECDTDQWEEEPPSTEIVEKYNLESQQCESTTMYTGLRTCKCAKQCGTGALTSQLHTDTTDAVCICESDHYPDTVANANDPCTFSCLPCDRCDGVTTWQSRACDNTVGGTGNTRCEPVTECGTSELADFLSRDSNDDDDDEDSNCDEPVTGALYYETMPPTETTDRVCDEKIICPISHYEDATNSKCTHSGGDSSNRNCLALTDCVANKARYGVTKSCEGGDDCSLNDAADDCRDDSPESCVFRTWDLDVDAKRFAAIRARFVRLTVTDPGINWNIAEIKFIQDSLNHRQIVPTNIQVDGVDQERHDASAAIDDNDETEWTGTALAGQAPVQVTVQLDETEERTVESIHIVQGAARVGSVKLAWAESQVLLDTAPDHTVRLLTATSTTTISFGASSIRAFADAASVPSVDADGNPGTTITLREENPKIKEGMIVTGFVPSEDPAQAIKGTVVAGVTESTEVQLANLNVGTPAEDMVVTGAGITGTVTVAEYDELAATLVLSSPRTIATGTELTFTDAKVVAIDGTTLTMARNIQVLESAELLFSDVVIDGMAMYTENRKCARYRVCDCDHWTRDPFPVDSDRTCEVLDKCTDDEYESEYPNKILVCDDDHSEDLFTGATYVHNGEPNPYAGETILGPFNSDHSQLPHSAPSGNTLPAGVPPHCYWLHTSNRKCTKFADHYGPRGVTISGQSYAQEIAYPAHLATGSNVCRDDDDPGARCNDGGYCEEPNCVVGPTLCPWGSDDDCPARSIPANIDRDVFCGSGRFFTTGQRKEEDPTTGTMRWVSEDASAVCNMQPCCTWTNGACSKSASATSTCDILLRNPALGDSHTTTLDTTTHRADDCFPFYHEPEEGTSSRWRGQYWNKYTVRAELPDVITGTAPGLSYTIIDNAKETLCRDTTDPGSQLCTNGFVKLLKWDFVKGKKILWASDNFFADEYWNDFRHPIDEYPINVSLLVSIFACDSTTTVDGNKLRCPATNWKAVGNSKEGARTPYSYTRYQNQILDSTFPTFAVTRTPPAVDWRERVQTGTVNDAVNNNVDVTLTALNRAIQVGMIVTGDGISGTVTVIDVSESTVTLSTASTILAATVLTFTDAGYARTTEAGQIVSVACQDANDEDGDGRLIYDPQKGPWYNDNSPLSAELGGMTCATFERKRSWCSLVAAKHESEGVKANRACCACGGGIRVDGTRMKVEVRDPAANGPTDGESIPVEDVINAIVDELSAEPYYLSQVDLRQQLQAMEASELMSFARQYGVATSELTDLALQHTTNIYEPPDSDWCVAQRIDTAEFNLYVFDMEKPNLECPQSTVVCTAQLEAPTLLPQQHRADLSGYSANYADIELQQPPADAASPRYPTVWPLSVTDNVNADVTFDGSGSPPTYSMLSTTVNTPEGYTEQDWIEKTDYEQAAEINGRIRPVIGDTVSTRWRNLDPVIWTSIPGEQRRNNFGEITTGSGSSGRYAIGSYTVTFTATDSFGNTDECEVQLEIKDCAPPLLLCKDVEEQTQKGQCFCSIHGYANDENLKAYDNSGVPPKITLVASSTLIPIDDDFKFPIGETIVKATATDRSGATAPDGSALVSTVFCTIKCVDMEKPTFDTPPPSVEVSCDQDSGISLDFASTGGSSEIISLTYANGTKVDYKTKFVLPTVNNDTNLFNAVVTDNSGKLGQGTVIIDEQIIATVSGDVADSELVTLTAENAAIQPGHVVRCTAGCADGRILGVVTVVSIEGTSLELSSDKIDLPDGAELTFGTQVTDATRFQYYNTNELVYLVTDEAGNSHWSEKFDVSVTCGTKWWRRTSFESPNIANCSSPEHSTGTVSDDGRPVAQGRPPMTCLLEASRSHADADGWIDLCISPPAGQPLTMCADGDATSGNIGFKTMWHPLDPPAESDNLGRYIGNTEEYDCDDVGVIRGATKAYTSPECLKTTSHRTHIRKMCTEDDGTTVYDLNVEFREALRAEPPEFESMAKLCTSSQEGNKWNFFGPLKADGTVCTESCSAEELKIPTAEDCILAVRRYQVRQYQVNQPSSWDDMYAAQYADTTVCLQPNAITDQPCETAAEPDRFLGLRHCYAVPTKNEDIPEFIVPDADDPDDRMGFSSFVFDTCLDHWPGYPHAKQVPEGSQYFAIADPDGQIRMSFDDVVVPRGQKQDQKRKNGNSNTWISFKYQVAGPFDTEDSPSLELKITGASVRDGAGGTVSVETRYDDYFAANPSNFLPTLVRFDATDGVTDDYEWPYGALPWGVIPPGSADFYRLVDPGAEAETFWPTTPTDRDEFGFKANLFGRVPPAGADWADREGAWTAPVRVSRNAAGWVEYTAKLPWFYQKLKLEATANSNDHRFLAWIDDIKIGEMGCTDPRARTRYPENGFLSSVCAHCKTPYSENNVVDYNNQIGELSSVSSCSYEISCKEKDANNFERGSTVYTSREKEGCWTMVPEHISDLISSKPWSDARDDGGCNAGDDDCDAKYGGCNAGDANADACDAKKKADIFKIDVSQSEQLDAYPTESACLGWTSLGENPETEPEPRTRQEGSRYFKAADDPCVVAGFNGCGVVNGDELKKGCWELRRDSTNKAEVAVASDGAVVTLKESHGATIVVDMEVLGTQADQENPPRVITVDDISVDGTVVTLKPAIGVSLGDVLYFGRRDTKVFEAGEQDEKLVELDIEAAQQCYGLDYEDSGDKRTDEDYPETKLRFFRSEDTTEVTMVPRRWWPGCLYTASYSNPLTELDARISRINATQALLESSLDEIRAILQQ